MSSDSLPITQSCALTFIGNSQNKKQQDAFFFLNDWFQETLGITNVETINQRFCIAVSDGVSSSSMSQHCSKALVAAIDKLWSQQESPNVSNIHKLMVETLQHKKDSSKYDGASATLAMVVGKQNKNADNNNDNRCGYILNITHVGDSRVYLLKSSSKHWQCLTRDHNLLNDLVDEQAQEEGREPDFASYNATGMASMLYSLTEYFVFSANSDNFENKPKGSTQSLEVSQGDSLLICTDGIHDLVPSSEWGIIDETTDLQAWLRDLKTQVYASEGNAYDNGTAIVVRVM